MSNNLNLNSKKYDFIFRSPEKILPITFFFLCIMGSIFLSLPNAINGKINFLDSVFTAVSAVCVTGLSVIDIGSKLTTLGQIILIIRARRIVRFEFDFFAVAIIADHMNLVNAYTMT